MISGDVRGWVQIPYYSKPYLEPLSVGTKWAEISAIVMLLNPKRGAAAGEGPD